MIIYGRCQFELDNTYAEIERQSERDRESSVAFVVDLRSLNCLLSTVD